MIHVTKTQESVYAIVDARTNQSGFAPESTAHSEKELGVALTAMGIKAEIIAELRTQLEKTWEISIQM